MTKIPFFLSALSLAGANTALSPTLDNINRVSDTPVAVVANENVAGLNFKQLNLATGQIKWDFQYQDNEGRTFSRYIMTSLNYMSGVTEEEADRQLATLGESKFDDWTTWRTTYSASDASFTSGTTLGATLAWGEVLKNNKSDLVYYAIQYKNWDDPSVEPVWYRGKIDYRSCAHSPNIESTYGMICQFSLDPVTNRYIITPDEGTLSYDDEMKQIARETYLDDVRKQIEELERRKAEGDESYRNELGMVGYYLGAAKVNITNMHLGEALADEIADLERMFEKLMQDDSAQPDPGDKDENGSDQDDKDDKDDGKTDSDNNSNIQKPEDNSNSEVGSTGNQVQSVEVSTGVTTAKIAATGTRKWHFSDSDNYVSSVATVETEGDIVGEVDDRSGSREESSSEVEIPNLGDEEPWLKRNLWALLLPVGLVALVVVLLIKRRDEEDEI